MTDTQTQTSPATQSKFVFDETKFKAQITDLETFYKEFAGQFNHNPFMFLYGTLELLQKRFAEGERTQELYDAAMVLKKEAPKVASLEPEKPIEAVLQNNPTQIATPRGLQFKASATLQPGTPSK